jgi:hypothetical protein
MTDVVTVILASDPAMGELTPTAPFLVTYERLPERSGLYYDEPDVIAQMAAGERQAQFEADWTDDGWVLGKRVSGVL